LSVTEFKELPVRIVNLKKQEPLISLVDKFLFAKAEDPKANTSVLEKQLDDMVYKIYELSEEDIAIVEGK